MDKKQYPKGHFITYGIAIGLPLGIPIGLALGNIGIGPAIGVALGTLIGMIWEKKYEKEGKIRPLTAEEKFKKKKNAKWVLLIGITIAILIVSTYFFFSQ